MEELIFYRLLFVLLYNTFKFSFPSAITRYLILNLEHKVLSEDEVIVMNPNVELEDQASHNTVNGGHGPEVSLKLSKRIKQRNKRVDFLSSLIFPFHCYDLFRWLIAYKHKEKGENPNL